MQLTKATQNDIPKIQELAHKSWENAYVGIISDEQIEYMLSTMYSETEISSQMKNPNYHYLLISDKEDFVGFMGFEHHYEINTTKLHRIYLIPEAKGKGSGKSTMEFLKILTKKSGDLRIILNVNKKNPAKNIYEKQGFKVYDEIILNIGNGFVMDDFLMEYFV